MRHVVAISGGKDSVAMALRLAEVEPREYDYLITPTGNELPDMVDHWQRLELMLGKPFIRLAPYWELSPEKKLPEVIGCETSDGQRIIARWRKEKIEVNGKAKAVRVVESIDRTESCEPPSMEVNQLADCIRRNGMIPNFRARFCTRQLKIEPACVWMLANSPCVQCVGLRADEQERAGLYGSLPGITQRCPLREWGWGIEEVLEYVRSKGVTIPTRTDCAWCFYQKLHEWKRLYRRHAELFSAGVEIEREIGATFRSDGRDSWPADLERLGQEFSKRPVKGTEDDRQLTLGNCDLETFCRVCSL